MRDTETGSKPAKPAKPANKEGAGQGWNAAADGQSVSKAFSFKSSADAAKMAKRALQLAERGGQTIDLRFAGSSVTVGLVAKAGAVADAERRLARRLEGKRSDEDKAARAARAAAKAKRPAKPSRPAKAAKPAKRAPKA